VVVAVLSFSLVCSFQSALVFYSLCVQFVRIFLHFIPPKKGLHIKRKHYDNNERIPHARTATTTTTRSTTHNRYTAPKQKLYEQKEKENGKRRDESRRYSRPPRVYFRHRILLRETEKPEEDAECVGVS